MEEDQMFLARQHPDYNDDGLILYDEKQSNS